MTELPRYLRRKLVELNLDRDEAQRQRGRRHGRLAGDWPVDDWMREIALQAIRTGGRVEAIYHRLLAQQRLGEGGNLLRIKRADLEILQELVDEFGDSGGIKPTGR